jgi:hypothetical protein
MVVLLVLLLRGPELCPDADGWSCLTHGGAHLREQPSARGEVQGLVESLVNRLASSL